MNKNPCQVISTIRKILDRPKKGRSGKEKSKYVPILLISSKTLSFQCRNSSFQNGYPPLITAQKISSSIPLTILSNSLQHPKARTPAWVADSKATVGKTAWKFNRTSHSGSKVHYYAFQVLKWFRRFEVFRKLFISKLRLPFQLWFKN